ncbi:L-threonate dehydrogenase [Bienertia sinuspersici]
MQACALTLSGYLVTAMCGKLYVFEGEIGAGSKVKMVIELLEAIHLVASVEAICLGVQAKIHPWILYDIISNAAGNSWVFKNHVPKWLSADHMNHQTVNALVENLAAILGVAKFLPFPLPLLGVSHQQLLGCSHVKGDDSSAPLFEVWGKVLGIKLEEAANEEAYNPLELARMLDSRSKAVKRIGFIGLGAMGFGMATQLSRSNFTVIGYDVYKPTLSRFIEAGGLVGNSPLEVSKGNSMRRSPASNGGVVSGVMEWGFAAAGGVRGGVGSAGESVGGVTVSARLGWVAFGWW